MLTPTQPRSLISITGDLHQLITITQIKPKKAALLDPRRAERDRRRSGIYDAQIRRRRERVAKSAAIVMGKPVGDPNDAGVAERGQGGEGGRQGASGDDRAGERSPRPAARP